MANPRTISPNGAKAIAFALFLIGLAFLTYFKTWWPGIMLAVGIPIAVKQYLLGRMTDMVISICVFVGIFITVQFKIKWEIVVPVLFAFGGTYILFREFFQKKETKEEKK